MSSPCLACSTVNVARSSFATKRATEESILPQRGAREEWSSNEIQVTLSGIEPDRMTMSGQGGSHEARESRPSRSDRFGRRHRCDVPHRHEGGGAKPQHTGLRGRYVLAER